MGAHTIVVGGGILGAATFWELAREGMEPLLYEAGRFGEGPTAKSAAIVRCHYSNPEVVRMAVRSRDRLRQLPLHLDCEPVFTQTGWLFLVDDEHAEAAALNSIMQDEEGVDSVEVDDLDEYLPGANGAGLAYALFEPEAGFADPVATTLAYVTAGRRAGGRAEEGTAVEAIEVEAGGAVRGARVAGELVECEHLVLAAGPWSAQLAAGIGLSLPLEITREQDVLYETAPEPSVPCAVSSQADAVYLRPVPERGDQHLLVGRGFPKEYETVEPDGHDETVDEAFEEDVRRRVVTRLPRLEGMRAVDGRVGLYDVTPDWHPLLGPVEGYQGLHLATGGSGHCFKLGPAIGELVAGAILGKPVGFASVTSFSLSRFAEGRVFSSSYGGNRA
ncbi:MAG TPA: FAD-binding oxidoreductase [Gaiellaceae bacterium]